jgi:hypothetical protein
MEVEVWNMGMMKKHHVGKAAVQLTTVLPKLNETKDVLINLTHVDKKGNKQQQGVVKMKCKIIDDEKPAGSAETEIPLISSQEKGGKDKAEDTAKQNNTLPEKRSEASKPPEKSPRLKNDSKDANEPTSKSPRSEKPPPVTEAPAKDIPVNNTGKDRKQTSNSDSGGKDNLLPVKSIEIADKSGKLKMTITELEVKDLMDTGSKGMFKDDQDPCLEISLGNQSFKTDRSIIILIVS